MADSRRKVEAEGDPKQSAGGSKPGSKPPAPGLYLVSTPIGNLGDITLRALEVLRHADAIYCEDTRVTGKLLAAYEIKIRLHPYHDHNAEQVRPELIGRLDAGEIVALVCDAGTPLVSDPGYKLVRECRERGLPVVAIPGASAVMAAIAACGLPSDRFCFIGFLPTKSAARRRALGDWPRLQATLVAFETGPRLAATLADMAEVLGDRQAVVARELTKLHEEYKSGTLAALSVAYTAEGPPKGEITIVVAPPGAADDEAIDLDSELRRALGLMSLRDAVAEVAAITGLPRRQVYSRALALAPSAGKLQGVE
ncbi:MAG: 16S rRNA (cytidine(1402)-2'-O)-methyltransferase [Alphaproteobacteria bacterium]|nr:16S rRNA (cytidine(1402)-2'-O)-methyltransferase [Alphaproteobacteria bacterium]